MILKKPSNSRIKFTPDDSFNNNYYSSLNKIEYTIQADLSVWWSSGYIPMSNNVTTMSIPVNYSVINYLPLKNLLNSEELKSNYRNIKANESKYVASSLDNYYKALAALYKFNLTDGLTEETVAAKAFEMKTLIEILGRLNRTQTEFSRKLQKRIPKSIH